MAKPGRPAAALDLLYPGVPLLQPAEQVFHAMLDGWRNQQLSRNLSFTTIARRRAADLPVPDLRRRQAVTMDASPQCRRSPRSTGAARMAGVKPIAEVVRHPIAAGRRHTVGLRADGTVVAVGADTAGECRTSTWRDVVAVAAGSVHVARNTGKSHTLGLAADGTVRACGWHNHGQCDVQAWEDIVGVSAGWRFSVGLRGDGTVVATERFAQAPLHGWRDVSEISCGDWHVVARRADETACATGSNTWGQCDVRGWTGLQALAAGYLHTLGLTHDGTVRATGHPSFWRGCERWTGVTAVAAGSYHSVGLTTEGQVVAAGSSEMGQCDVGGWRDIVAVEAGGAHTVGLRADGSVVATGDDSHGQLETAAWHLT